MEDSSFICIHASPEDSTRWTAASATCVGAPARGFVLLTKFGFVVAREVSVPSEVASYSVSPSSPQRKVYLNKHGEQVSDQNALVSAE